ncbi:MAG: hypothetical protein PQ612_10675 [Rickettsiales bacterium]|nr:hypothetical protein [Pseudomonadota bacterium]MDA0966910.1 hypothetical protein [Pseudomonadota bacterium]MDG4544463.1 hypothetical protein [Rickettsiales bacterium]MDG4546614.1 hypothetical protein [Rickettsiales bacterium]MDG4548739.1 hypothetical protein [Rickettsiales bacterium]
MPDSNSPSPYQKEVISETIEYLNDNTDTQELSQKLNNNTPLSNEDPLRFIVGMFRDTSMGRLKDLGNASDTALRNEIIGQLTDRFKTDENPEPFSSVNLDIANAGEHVRRQLRRTRAVLLI